MKGQGFATLQSRNQVEPVLKMYAKLYANLDLCGVSLNSVARSLDLGTLNP